MRSSFPSKRLVQHGSPTYLATTIGVARHVVVSLFDHAFDHIPVVNTD